MEYRGERSRSIVVEKARELSIMYCVRCGNESIRAITSIALHSVPESLINWSLDSVTKHWYCKDRKKAAKKLAWENFWVDLVVWQVGGHIHVIDLNLP